MTLDEWRQQMFAVLDSHASIDKEWTKYMRSSLDECLREQSGILRHIGRKEALRDIEALA